MVNLRSQTSRTRTLRNRVIADDNHNNNNNNNRKGKLSKKRSREQQSDETTAGKRFQPDDRQPDDRQPDDRQPDDRQDDDRQPDDRQPDDREANDREPDDRQPDDRQPDDREANDREPDVSDFQSFLLRDPKAKALYTQMFKSYLPQNMNHKMASHRCALLPRKNSGQKQLSQVCKVLPKLSLMTKAHLAQTAHNKTTAEDIYIGREGTSEDRDQLLSIYCDDLSSDNPDPEEAEEAVDDKESDVSNVTPINTVTPTEQPAANVTREQTVTADARRRSTIGQSSEDVLREKFIKSLKSFRVKSGATKWTDPEKKHACFFPKSAPLFQLQTSRHDVRRQDLDYRTMRICGYTQN